MRRSSLPSRLAHVAVAYLLALQALLGAWTGHAVAQNGFDPSLTLCRTDASEDTLKSDRDAALPQHCAVMCLSGVCASGDPPAVASAEVEFRPLRAPATSISGVHVGAGGTSPHLGVSARGPPLVA